MLIRVDKKEGEEVQSIIPRMRLVGIYYLELKDSRGEKLHAHYAYARDFLLDDSRDTVIDFLP